MKTIKYLFFSVIFVSFFSCEVEMENIVTENAAQGGVTLQLQGGGQIFGAPADGTDLENSTVDFSDVALDLNVIERFAFGDVVKYELLKSLNGGMESVVAEIADLPLNLSYASIDDFMSGTEVSDSDDLRIGDTFKFRTRITKQNGEQYFIHDGGPDSGTFSISVACAADLSGTYLMTNSVCTSEVMVTITGNPDGSWYASTADGGLLQFCSSNPTLENNGTFSVSCGAVQPSGDLAFCPGYGIGCILGGTWDESTGTLNMTHGNGFFSWADAEYTSTYIRQ